ncbi:transposase [Microbacterium wangchenii]|uniref:transposase n=1 Tax=Microbacterium wangchenii TaxID=2541726 RepID=UPI0021C2A57A|nr:transposase [Microbacterium wangchenii]
MPKPHPSEFRDDVVRVAMNREPGVTIEQIAKDFGVHPVTLQKWMRRADIDEGAKPGQTRTESVELRQSQRSSTHLVMQSGASRSGANRTGRTSIRPPSICTRQAAIRIGSLVEQISARKS